MRPRSPTTPALLVLLAAVSVAIAGCTSSGTPIAAAASPTSAAVHPELGTTADTRVIPDIEYGRADGRPLLLDACLPASTASTSTANPAPRAAIVMIHGGSWTRGDKATPAYRAVCQWLAANGYPTFAVDYRLAPAHIFPAALDDVRLAVEWLRADRQLGRFHLDPTRIGAFGGSAGGNLAAMLGTDGLGPLTEGSRVSAVVDLSGPADLTGADTRPEFLPIELSYLGCTSETLCPAARAASPIFHVSADDAPFFIANSSDERIPFEQSQRLADALTGAGVPTTLVAVKGGLHSIAMLGPSLRERILAFYASTLGANDAESGESGESGAG